VNARSFSSKNKLVGKVFEKVEIILCF